MESLTLEIIVPKERIQIRKTVTAMDLAMFA